MPTDAAGPATLPRTGTTAKNTESLHAKLKRLVARSVLTEPEPGLFALAQPATSNPYPTPES